ncbi:hypothetical protein U1Q18_026051 [Sarracenia purpurea var. burkii]
MILFLLLFRLFLFRLMLRRYRTRLSVPLKTNDNSLIETSRPLKNSSSEGERETFCSVVHSLLEPDKSMKFNLASFSPSDVPSDSISSLLLSSSASLSSKHFSHSALSSLLFSFLSLSSSAEI